MTRQKTCFYNQFKEGQYLIPTVKIIIEEEDLLSQLCGSGDCHLKTLERLFGVPVYPLGNELHLKSANSQVRLQFHSLIRELHSQFRQGQTINRELIESLNQAIKFNDEAQLKAFLSSSITIPHSSTKIFPRSWNQANYIEAIRSFDLCFGLGSAGTGKTFLAIAVALSEILGKKKRKLLLTRPVVETGESLGYLPGDLTQKISPYLRPLYDAMQDLIPSEIINRLEETRIIEIAPLAYMRGRSLKNCFVILDEAQNTTKVQMKMFLTRLGENCKVVITGDPTQIDLSKIQESGLIHAQKLLNLIPGIHFAFFEKKDVVRSLLTKQIIEAYENAQ